MNWCWTTAAVRFDKDIVSRMLSLLQVRIPAKETTYWCQIKQLPAYLLQQKHHVVKYEGVISRQSVGIVHHMEVFHCDLPGNVAVRSYNAECKVSGAERPRGLESCRQVIGAWAMGAVVSVIGVS